MREELKKRLEKQQYRIVGNHSASKVCEYVKKSLTGKDVCYKNTFYGIQTHRCVQMTPTVNHCPNECVFCWRAIEKGLNEGTSIREEDPPEEIIEGCIKEQLQMLVGFKGNEKIEWDKYEEAQKPLHFAISLSGEPTLYSRLSEMINILRQKGMTSFVVSNGMYPERLKTIRPTQLYVSVFAPDSESYEKISGTKQEKPWEKLMQTMDVLKELREEGVRTCLRITAIKGMNMVMPEKYAEIIKKADPLFIEVKSYMWVGFSQLRLSIENMPSHEETKEFAGEICKYCYYDIVDEKKNSRVLLLMKKEDREKRFLNLD